jgi:hypothetical protein
MRRNITSLLGLTFLFSLLLVSCNTPTPDPTQIAILPDTPTTAPPIETVILPTNQPVLSGDEGPTAIPVSAPERATYIINATLDYQAKTVSMDQTILYPNHSGETLNNLVLAVVPNMWPGGFNLNALSVDDSPITNYDLQGQKLDFTLPTPFAPENTIKVTMQYTLILPFAEQLDPSVERPRIYGYTARQVNLANWYPFIVPYEAGAGWVLHDPWYYGEHLVYEAADFEVNLTTDPSVVVAASGFHDPAEPVEAGSPVHYTLTAGRTFAISASPEFQTISTQVGDVTVSSYYFPFYEAPGKAVLDASAQAIEIYSQLYGPYPHKTLAVVMGDFNDGMEYSALYFHSRGIYNLYNGKPDNLVVAVAVHETAHQWWFERVANDQALAPWMDEALCAYSERIFYERTHPDLVNWWWGYWVGRVGGSESLPKVDITVYDGGGFTPYTNTVYLGGAHFLEDLRTRIGDQAFFAFLGDYAAQMDGKIATPQDFFAILRQHTSADISDLIANYFTNAY